MFHRSLLGMLAVSNIGILDFFTKTEIKNRSSEVISVTTFNTLSSSKANTLKTNHVYSTLKRRGKCRFNMEYTCCVCRVRRGLNKKTRDVLRLRSNI